MIGLLRTWVTALAASWPEVLAWYLGGTLVREGILTLAAPIGPDSALVAFLLLPIAVLARLVSFVGMFLAVRRSLPAFAATTAESGVARRGRFSGFADVLLASIVPFFVLYGLLGLLQDDFAAYANRAFLYSFGGGDFLSPGDGPLVVVVIVVALAGRIVLKRFGSRLPRGATIVEIYLEAVWVFVAVSGLSAVFAGVLAWVQDRQIVRWFLDVRQGLRDLWEPIRVTIDGIDGLVPLLLQLLALPLAWLLIAGIVYTRELASVAGERVLSPRLEANLRARAQRLPAFVTRRRIRHRRVGRRLQAALGLGASHRADGLARAHRLCGVLRPGRGGGAVGGVVSDPDAGTPRGGLVDRRAARRRHRGRHRDGDGAHHPRRLRFRPGAGRVAVAARVGRQPCAGSCSDSRSVTSTGRPSSVTVMRTAAVRKVPVGVKNTDSTLYGAVALGSQPVAKPSPRP